MKNVRFLDLSIQDENQLAKIMQAIKVVLKRGILINGPEVEQFEKAMADFCSRKYAVGVNSGSDALLLALKSIGVGPGDEVITTSLSWIATANAIRMTGAEPVFADIDDDLNISPESVERMISSKTRAIVPVHYTGKLCRIRELMEIARNNQIALVEDSAQAFGAGIKGKVAGSYGDVACFSMNPMKVFAACGEAGLVLTDNLDVKQRLEALRYNGTVNKEELIQPSLNGRIDTVQAAILLERLNDVENVISSRRKIAGYYADELSEWVKVPDMSDEHQVFYTFTVQAENRNRLKEFLERQHIETKIQHPILMPDQKPYQHCRKDSLISARHLVTRILSIPANEKTTMEEAGYVVDKIKEFYS